MGRGARATVFHSAGAATPRIFRDRGRVLMMVDRRGSLNRPRRNSLSICQCTVRGERSGEPPPKTAIDCNRLQSEGLQPACPEEPARHLSNAVDGESSAIGVFASVRGTAARLLRPIQPFVLISLALRGRAGQPGSRAENRERDKEEPRRQAAGGHSRHDRGVYP